MTVSIHRTSNHAGSRRNVVWGRARRALVVLALMVCAASAAAAQVRVTAAWDANTDGVTAGYRVFVGLTSGVSQAEVDTGTATSVPLDLPLGATYYVWVRAYNGSGQLGPPSAEAVVDLAGPPGTPTDFRVGVNGSQATLQWGPPATGTRPTQYLLTVGSVPGGADIVSSYPVGSGGSASGDLPLGRYYARLRASNALGAGPFTPEITFQITGGHQPASPVGLSAAWQGTVATLSWSPPSSVVAAPDLPTSYIIEAGRASGAIDVASFNVGNVTSYATDVLPGTYFVRVRGANAFGVSDPSNEIVLQGPGAPGRPLSLSASGTGSAVNLRWNAPTSGGSPTGYTIEAGSAPGLSDLAVLTTGNQTTLATTAPPGTYYVRVRAVNARGASDPSNEIVVRR